MLIKKNETLVKLKELFLRKKLPHAILLEGEKGIGKRTLALYLAKLLNCKDAEKPCLDCNICNAIENRSHPDVYFISGEGKTESIGIGKIREVKNTLNVLPNQSDYKIYIIPDAGNMTIEAQNAFLKSLEEPVTNTFFILTASDKSFLLETVLSRVTVFPLLPYKESEISEFLNEKYPKFENTKLKTAASLSGGIVGTAISFLADDENRLLTDGLNVLKSISEKKYTAVLSIFSAYEKKKPEAQLFLNILCRLYDDILNFKFNKNYHSAFVIYKEQLSKYAVNFTEKHILTALEMFNKTSQALKSNVNPTLSLSVLAISLFSE